VADRRAIASALSGAPLTAGAELPAGAPPVRIHPTARVLKIGGQSVLDRGREAVAPLVEELVAARAEHELVIGTGGGTRARHLYAIASELGMPTGVLAELGSYVPEQNASMLQMLMAAHGGVHVGPGRFEELPLFLRMGCTPILGGMAPFGAWEKPAEGTRVPAHRTDAGVYLLAEALGVRRVIFVKDERGLFEDDPKKNPDAAFIPRVSAAELIERDLPDLVVERVVLEYLTRAKHCTEVQVIDGLERGNLARALAGEDVGTVITGGAAR
jgi:molybdenum storage protein